MNYDVNVDRRASVIKRERARRASEQRGIHMQRRGFRPIFSKVSGPIRSGHVGKSSGGLRERQIYKNFFGNIDM